MTSTFVLIFYKNSVCLNCCCSIKLIVHYSRRLLDRSRLELLISSHTLVLPCLLFPLLFNNEFSTLYIGSSLGLLSVDLLLLLKSHTGKIKTLFASWCDWEIEINWELQIVLGGYLFAQGRMLGQRCHFRLAEVYCFRITSEVRLSVHYFIWLTKLIVLF